MNYHFAKLRAHGLVIVSILMGTACRPSASNQNEDVGTQDSKQALTDTLRTLSEPPETYLGDIRKSEDAVTRVMKTLLKPLCQTLRNGHMPAKYLSQDFIGRWLEVTHLASSNEKIETHALTKPTGPLRPEEFRHYLQELASKFSDMQRCHIGIAKFKLISETEAWGVLDFNIAGTYPDSSRKSYSGSPQVRFIRTKGKWQFSTFSPKKFAQTSVKKPLFIDIGKQLGADFRLAKKVQSVIQHQIDSRKIETIGGLAVIDLNNDGRDDFIAWHQRRTIQIFINDGVSGFDRIIDPIPAKHVGLFHLFMDLDNDQIPEIISTEITSCRNGVAEFPVYKRSKKGFKLIPGALRFNRNCEALDQIKFQHIAVGDVDNDGLADLFFSGFSDRHSKSLGHNRFRSKTGEPNRLFVAQGRMKYKEEAAARGVAGTSFSYGATFLDYNGSGALDLYVVNDYGRNSLYLNNGTGNFQKSEGNLSQNGQSMGVSHVDINGDGELDLYVSNMYSKAGNRIVPLAESQLKKETYLELLAVAQGNSAFIRENGDFTDQAQDLGIAKAGWAWGHTFFDADLDGDRDLLVLNGNLTHSATQAPDY
jgi:hypothetical protein